jgi:hypothetical protein
VDAVKHRSDSKVILEGWISYIGLESTLEINIFALVYGFCKTGGSYYGSLEHTAEWFACSTRSALRAFSSLVGRGYLNKEERREGAIKHCSYTVNMDKVESELKAREMTDCPSASDNLSHNSTIYISSTDNKINNKTLYNIEGQNVHREKTEKPETREERLKTLNWDRPLAAEDSRLVIPWWNECCKFWNGLGLKPECRIFLTLPAKHDREIVKIFRGYSLKEILNATENYSQHRRTSSPDYIAALTFGSIETFLIGGVQRYFDDAAFDDLFRVKPREAGK